MLLAAGRGRRLRPLTDDVPKPLIPVGQHRLIEYSILKLKAAGINNIVINVCYLAKKIISFLGDGSRYGVNIEYSLEGEECLGTGGGIYRALTLLGDKPFWLISADIWSDFISFDAQLNKDTYAHLLMVPNPEFHPDGDYGISEQGIISTQLPKFTYSGISLLAPKLFNGCRDEEFSLSPIFNKAIKRSQVSGELFAGDWFNVGTEKQLKRLREKLSGQVEC